MKKFWQSKTIILAFVGLVFIVLDYYFGFGLVSMEQDLEDTLIINGEIVTGFNWVALLSFLFTILMRVITNKGIDTGRVSRIYKYKS